MKKIILFLFSIPGIVNAGGISSLEKRYLSARFADDFVRRENKLILSTPKGLNNGGLPKAFYPWGLAATAVFIGGGVAYWGSYKDNLPLAITGGTVAIAGGALAVISLSPLRKYVGLAGNFKQNKNALYAFTPVGMYLSYRF